MDKQPVMIDQGVEIDMINTMLPTVPDTCVCWWVNLFASPHH